jgi:hypothetical protein
MSVAKGQCRDGEELTESRAATVPFVKYTDSTGLYHTQPTLLMCGTFDRNHGRPSQTCDFNIPDLY